MEIKTKQRLVGILVLLALLAIFLPVLFHTSRPSVVKPLSVAIPPKPAQPKVLLSNTEKKEQAELAPVVEHAAATIQPVASTLKSMEQAAPKQPIQPLKKAAEAPAKPTVPAKKQQPAKKPTSTSQKPAASKQVVATEKEPLDLKSGAPQAWVVQLGAFALKDNADHLITKLRNKGFDAYTRPITLTQGKRLYRVYVGPEIHLESVQKLRAKLQATYHLNGVVRKYQI